MKNHFLDPLTSKPPKSGPKLLFWKKQPKKRREMWFQDGKKDEGSYFIDNEKKGLAVLDPCTVLIQGKKLT